MKSITVDIHSGHMRPPFASDDSGCLHGTNPVLTRQRALTDAAGSEAFTHGPHVNLGQFGVARSFAAGHTLRVLSQSVAISTRLPIAPLGVPVGGVVLGRAEPKVCRVDAQPGIAGMQHVQASRDGAIVDLPREPMGTHHATPAVTNADLAVPTQVAATSPEPAGAGIAPIDVLPETFFWSAFQGPAASGVVVARPRAVCASVPRTHHVAGFEELDATRAADTADKWFHYRKS